MSLAILSVTCAQDFVFCQRVDYRKNLRRRRAPTSAPTYRGTCAAGFKEVAGDTPGWGKVNNKGGGQRVSTNRAALKSALKKYHRGYDADSIPCDECAGMCDDGNRRTVDGCGSCEWHNPPVPVCMLSAIITAY